jgi:hypothetical protein
MWGVELQNREALDVVADVALRVGEVEGAVEEGSDLHPGSSRVGPRTSRSGGPRPHRASSRRLLKQGKIVHVDAAYDRPGHETEFARTPTERCARRGAEVPAAERHLVLRNVVDEGPGVHREDLLRETTRFFGWARRRHPGSADRRHRPVDRRRALIESDGGLMPVEGP